MYRCEKVMGHKSTRNCLRVFSSCMMFKLFCTFMLLAHSSTSAFAVTTTEFKLLDTFLALSQVDIPLATEAIEQGKSNDYVKNAYVYRLNDKVMNNPNQTILQLNLTPDLTIYAYQQKVTQSASGTLLWRGSASLTDKMPTALINDESSADSVMWVNRNGSVTATVRINGRLFKIQPIKPLVKGLHRVLEIDQTKFKSDH